MFSGTVLLVEQDKVTPGIIVKGTLDMTSPMSFDFVTECSHRIYSIPRTTPGKPAVPSGDVGDLICALLAELGAIPKVLDLTCVYDLQSADALFIPLAFEPTDSTRVDI
jgi:hypothetical protein